MAGSIPNELNYGYFIPTTSVWDVTPIYQEPLNEESIRELLVRIYQNSNQMALAVNAKDTALYVQEEFLPGQLWFQNPNLPAAQNPSTSQLYRDAYRKVIDFGALPNAAVKTVAHNITTTNITWTRIYGTATNSTTKVGLPLPYASSIDLAHNIDLFVTATQVTISTGTNYSAFDQTVVVLEYLKD